jgi:aspartate/methionine/tyrosine aminotransferase
VIPQGTYYMLAETGERFPGSTSEEVVDMLIERSGVGAVPASDFMGPEVKGDPARSNFMRFCYAVADEQLQDAADRLQRLNS